MGFELGDYDFGSTLPGMGTTGSTWQGHTFFKPIFFNVEFSSADYENSE
jgi:hypothetical protein